MSGGAYKKLYRRKGINVTVVVDWAKCRRKQFWRDILKKYKNLNIHLVSIADNYISRWSKSLINLKKTDILILNWDVVNKDPTFGADITYDYFYHRRPEIYEWVENGGVLVMENQVSRQQPFQDAYDAVLKGVNVEETYELDRVEDFEKLSGNSGKIFAVNRDNLLEGITDDYLRSHATLDDLTSPVFPKDTVPLAVENLFRKERIFSGWFVDTQGEGWEVLIKGRDPREGRDQEDHPILLFKKINRGAIITTTMYLAQSRLKKLIENIVKLRLLHDEELTLKFRYSSPARFILRVIMTPILAIAVFTSGYFVGGQLGASITSAIIAVIVGFLLHRISK